MQVTAFIPLVYMCVCTYYSLFKFGMLTFYSFTPRQTNSVSLLMICSYESFSLYSTTRKNCFKMCIISFQVFTRQVARYAAPISYNFLNLIRLPTDAKDSRTIFEKVSLFLLCLSNSACMMSSSSSIILIEYHISIRLNVLKFRYLLIIHTIAIHLRP